MSHFWTSAAILLILTCAGVRPQDANRVVFSLGSFQNVTVPRNGSVRAVVTEIPSDVARVTLQFHTWARNATLSHTQAPSAGSAHTAVDAGLLSPLLPLQSSLTWYLLSPDGDALPGVGVVLPYQATDPVPGGCALGYDPGADPNVHLQHGPFETRVRFAPASAGFPRGAPPPACEVIAERLEYEVYQYFLPPGDLSEQSLLFHIQRAADVASMRDHGKKVATLSVANGTALTFASAPGRGVIYSVTVRDVALNTTASYVPAHAYACGSSPSSAGCLAPGKTSSKLFFTLCGLGGLFVCFFGHRFFKCELFFMGFVFGSFLFFILITRTAVLDYDIRLALTTVMGVVGGVVLVMSWWRFGSVLSCVVVVGLVLGFLLASILFYTPLGDLPVFRSEVIFWLTFSCVMALVPLFFVRWPREGNIVCCGVAGAYAVVLAVGEYVYTSLSYITLDVLERLLSGSVSGEPGGRALRDLDLVMMTVWVVLGVSGAVLQLYRERTRAFFPPSPYLLWIQARERRKTNVLDPSYHVPSLGGRARALLRGLFRRSEPAGERTPLLL